MNLGGRGSDEVANILRKAGSKVKLVISRIVDEEPPEIPVRPDHVSVSPYPLTLSWHCSS